MDKKIFSIPGAFKFLNPSTNIDYTDQRLIKKLDKYNPWLLVDHYRKSGQKEKAINVLISKRMPGFSIDISEQIVHTYLYFSDHDGALNYLYEYEIGHLNVKYLEFLVKASEIVENQIPNTFDLQKWNELNKIVQGGLKLRFHKPFFQFLLDYRKNQTSNEENSLLLDSLGSIEVNILTEKYISNLQFSHIKYLYEIMPNKKRYLEIMISTNPFLDKKYYLEYFDSEFVRRDILEFILSNRYQKWAYDLYKNLMDGSQFQSIDTYCEGKADTYGPPSSSNKHVLFPKKTNIKIKKSNLETDDCGFYF